jgi:CBS domain-containing protein
MFRRPVVAGAVARGLLYQLASTRRRAEPGRRARAFLFRLAELTPPREDHHGHDEPDGPAAGASRPDGGGTHDPGPQVRAPRRDGGRAAAFLEARGFGAAPVIDDAGRPVGVLSRTDLLRNQARTAVHPARRADGGKDRPAPDATAVRDVMTPVVFCVHPDDPATGVVEKMLALNVRRLFVVDDAGVLVGVVSAFDVLRGLGRQFLGEGRRSGQ